MRGSVLFVALLAGCLAPAAIEEQAGPAGVENLVVVDPPPLPPGLARPLRTSFDGRIDLNCRVACALPDSWPLVSQTWAFDVPPDARRINATFTWSSPAALPELDEMAIWVSKDVGEEWEVRGESWGVTQPLVVEILLEAADAGPWWIEVMSWDHPPADVNVEVEIA